MIDLRETLYFDEYSLVRKEYLDKLELHSCKDIIMYLPYRYDDLTQTSLDIVMNEKVVVAKGIVVAKSSFARIISSGTATFK